MCNMDSECNISMILKELIKIIEDIKIEIKNTNQIIIMSILDINR
jgi:hypothetical protein